MLRKIIAWPISFIGKSIAIAGVFMTMIAGLIKGKSIKDIDRKLSRLELGIGCIENKDSAIIELVEIHHGSGKAMQVAAILDGDKQ